MRLIPKRAHLICLAYIASFKFDQYLIKYYTAYRICHVKKKKDALESIKSDQSAYKHIAFKVTFFFVASIGKLHKIFSIIWVCPTENKTHLRYFPAFSIALIFCRLSHYFQFILKTSPADTEPRVWEEKGQSNLYLTCTVWSPCHRLGPHTHTHDFTAIQTHAFLCIRSRDVLG